MTLYYSLYIASRTRISSSVSSQLSDFIYYGHMCFAVCILYGTINNDHTEISVLCHSALFWPHARFIVTHTIVTMCEHAVHVTKNVKPKIKVYNTRLTHDHIICQ